MTENFNSAELKSKIDEVGKLVCDLRNKNDELKKDILDEISIENMKIEMKSVKEEVDIIKAAQNAPQAEETKQSDIESEYAVKFNQWFTKGKGEQELEALEKALSIGVDSEGGYSVPAAALNLIDTRIFETSPMEQYATVVNTNIDKYEYVIDNDEASVSNVSEKGARAETNTPTLDKKVISVHEKYANAFATQTILDDSAFNMEQWLSGKLASKFARDCNTDYIVGDGVAEANGFLNAGHIVDRGALTTASSYSATNVESFKSGSAGSFSADNLISLIGKLKFEYRGNAIVAGSRETETDVALLKDGDNRYLFEYDQAGVLRVRGIPFVVFNDMPDPDTDTYSIAVGDFGAAYTIVKRKDMNILRDPYSNKPYIAYYATKRVGGDVVNYEAIKLLKLSS